MIWSLIKVAVFVALAAALAFGASFIQDTPGEVLIAFGGREISLTPLVALIGILVAFAAFWILLKLAGLLVAILRTSMGDQTALRRYFDKNRERRGYAALSDGLIAVASGEAQKAVAKANKAEKLLHKPELTLLLNAQAAEMTGDRTRAIELYKQLLGEERTRFVGIQGLMKAKLEEGDTARALQLAQKAFVLKPRHPQLLKTLFALQSNANDWAGARTTLLAKSRAKIMPKDLATRREAVLSVADAMAKHSAGNAADARDAAIIANRNAPSLVPAAVLAAQVYISEGTKRNAVRVLRKAWEANPHPDLATAFASIEPHETTSDRVKRFASFLAIAPDHPETRQLETELLLAAEDFPAARRALGDLATQNPTTRILALMAAISRGEGAAEEVVRGYLARALAAPRGEQWVCSACNSIHAKWAPTCSNCTGFDTLSWALPAESSVADLPESILPLLETSVPDSEQNNVDTTNDVAGPDTSSTTQDGNNADPEAEEPTKDS